MVKVVNLVVEGKTDRAVALKILDHLGLEAGAVHGQRGKQAIDRDISGYNHAARRSFWWVLRDLDHDAPCPPELRVRLLPDPAPGMRLRFAVRAVEAWLLADRESISDFFGLSIAKLPPEPDRLNDPKSALLTLVRRSRSKATREDMLPRPGTTAKVGPGYTGRLIELAIGPWRPEVAARSSPSLRRCLTALQTLGAVPNPFPPG